ncbi:MAG: ATP-grasp domain-containing protein, partial [Candidatus Bathyarchaeia archaeon]
DILAANGIPTPKYRVILSGEEEIGDLSFPLMVKPLREDASIGICVESVVRGEAELRVRVKYIRETYRQPALVEEYIEGRELNVAILGNDPPQVLPISEILFLNKDPDQPKLVDYQAKWVEESDAYKSTKPICPAPLPPHLRDLVASTALKAYKVLGCRDYARIDIRLRDGVPYVLEANPNPDISIGVGFHRSLKTAGIAYEDFILRLINFALNRV